MDAPNTVDDQIGNRSSTKSPNRFIAGRFAELAILATIFVWVGAAITGNLIAAPAKFQAPSLTLPIALDVGRMQFLWIGVFEALCVLAIVSLLLIAKQRPWPTLLAGIGLFASQRLWLMPLLDTRTLMIIAGQPVGESSLHLLYVAAEILKVGCLIWAGMQATRFLCREDRCAVRFAKS